VKVQDAPGRGERASAVAAVVRVVVPLLVLALFPASGGAALPVPVPYTAEGDIAGSPYRISIPVNWNGTLLLYAPGFLDQPDDGQERQSAGARTATVAPDLTIFGDGGTENALLAAGYGLAGTRYAADGLGMDGRGDILALVTYLHDEVVNRPDVRGLGTLRQTVLVACSLGSLFAYDLMNHPLSRFDGALTLGGLGGGLDREADWILAFRLAYDAVFGWPEHWGRVDDVRNTGDDPSNPEEVDWEKEALPTVTALLADPRNLPRFEFIRTVLGMPLAGFYPGTELNPGNLPWVMAMLLLATEATADAEMNVGGAPYQNLDHRYQLSPADSEYVRSLGLDPAPLLQVMNHQAVRPQEAARQRMQEKFGFGTHPSRPILTMKNIADGIAPPWHDGFHAASSEKDLLLQLFVNEASHCVFSPPQLLAALRGMGGWITTGRKPASDQFPSALGFVQDFSPPPSPFSAR
jgi:hypothetical protein